MDKIMSWKSEQERLQWREELPCFVTVRCWISWLHHQLCQQEVILMKRIYYLRQGGNVLPDFVCSSVCLSVFVLDSGSPWNFRYHYFQWGIRETAAKPWCCHLANNIALTEVCGLRLLSSCHGFYLFSTAFRQLSTFVRFKLLYIKMFTP